MGGRGTSSAASDNAIYRELQNREKPNMPASYSKAMDLAEKYRDMYEEYGRQYTWRMMDSADSEWLAFHDNASLVFEAKMMNDRDPEYVYAIRYGEVPKSGRSTNWAEGSSEAGVSTVKIIRNKEDVSYQSIYDATLGYQGIDKYIVGGWYIGGSGSDGEPLLLGAKEIKKLKKRK